MASNSHAEPSTTAKEQELPARAAGGGQPSARAASSSLTPFSVATKNHLLSAYKTLPAQQRAQDGHGFQDEPSFLSYMASSESSAMSPSVPNDLTYPLSSYYISSSHNTYLSGHQLYGDASAEAYTNVLKRGCRCLEIDVWDGSDSDTSSSDEEDEQDWRGSKASRWDRVKAKASRMRSRSRSGSLRNPTQPVAQSNEPGTTPQSQPRTEPHGLIRQSSAASAIKPTYLSPQPSPAIPLKCEPRVLHGYTLTQPIPFRAVCNAIRESAFVSTDLPLIVSLEVHASPPQQEIMVQIMKEAWSNLLVNITPESQVAALPSPESLKRRILIKVKWSPTTEEPNVPIERVKSHTTEGSQEDEGTSSPEKRPKKVLAALSELGIYTRAYTFKAFSQPEATIPTHVFSLSENKAHTMHPDPISGPALFEHNKKYLMRIFPKATRIRSSNVDPTFHWRQGAQMVALNWQRLDRGMMLNEGMFAGLGGWVLKPEGYRASHPDDEPEKGSTDSNTTILPTKHSLNLEITLLAAQNLPLPFDKDGSNAASKLKPYIKLHLHVDTHGPPGRGYTNPDTDAHSGEEIDDKIYERKSATGRTADPDFGGEQVTWTKIPDIVEELSFLRYVPTLRIILSLSFHRLAFSCLCVMRAKYPPALVRR
ncbi:uncharacterized protein A1O9_12125 [Exophiala aquamarina CBS 119918]|uniref:Phosphoinositide phospholipase C n=1 Tax=Exophiala aquamarina CBS 119918 TaxID=1182545 RepID=A0A072NXR1_9EURO|nr:uncharacterized protein A1O9_12125 [Exophiala aquamarina CBS 119918]KEF51788.1 hypothetical protein A1O9_12125 [Exophiala aquamarina CBS 119918]